MVNIFNDFESAEFKSFTDRIDYAIKHENKCIYNSDGKDEDIHSGGLYGTLRNSRRVVRDKVMELDIVQLLPTVKIDGDNAIIVYSFWNDWKGLVRNTVSVVKIGVTVCFEEINSEVLVEYSCGIHF